ncbi:unnamed protein product [Orchesella dallaii]|uniref:Methyl farnesoate epoxidase n=1 Tax=Orchesella dallaii TaxID=48710 RepID=A0ABP1PW32_9HEXA
MELLGLLLFCTVLLLTAILYLKWNGGNKLLPGPKLINILCDVPLFVTKPHVAFSKWAKTYGPIFQLRTGMRSTIVISDARLAKELFNDYASTGRSYNPIIHEFSKGAYGLINAEGESWETHRRFTLRTFRNVGFSKTSMEGLILDEVRAMLERFKKFERTPISGNRIFNAPVVNSLWHIVAGERFEWESGRDSRVFRAADDFFNSLLRVSTNGLIFAPILRFIAPDLLGWTSFKNSIENLHQIFESTIKNHEAEVNNSNFPRDYIDYALKEIENTKDPNSSFFGIAGRTNLSSGIFDLFQAGSETTANTLSWSLLYLSNYSEAQQRLYTEIKATVGSSRAPALSDRIKMPYTEAVIAETLRLSNVVPLGVPHRMNCDKSFNGYILPKDSIVFVNLYGILHDEQVWGDPFNFRPMRFLNEDGSQYIRHESFIPFSIGKRQCIGESLVRDTLFLFITSIFQQFEVLPHQKTETPIYFEADNWFLLVPKTFKVVMNPRVHN